MILRLFLLSVALFSTFQVQAGVWDRIKSVFLAEEEPDPPTIRALIGKEMNQANVEVKGSFNVYDPYKNEKVSTRFGSKKAMMASQTHGIKWGEEYVGTYQLKIVPDSIDTSILVNGTEYKGIVFVYDLGGSLSFINEVDIEDYVASILTPMLDLPCSKETMNALAIAVRTDAYHQSTHAHNPYWHVDSNRTGYQGYGVTNRSNGVNKAVSDTRYMVLNLSTAYKGENISTFPTQIVSKSHTEGRHNVTSISVDEVERLAQRGAPADRILTKFFPNTTISLTHNFDAPSKHHLAELVED